MTDIIVVGGGPAGMTAALYAQRNGKSALVLEKHGFGGQITYSPKVENWPGTAQMSGNEYAEALLDQIMAQGAEVDLAEVVRIEDHGSFKRVFTDDGLERDAKAVVVAAGVKHRMLGLPGENELVGEGISFCAVCDGDFYTGKTVCVAGGGNSAMQEALLLSENCERVTMIQNLAFLTGEEALKERVYAKENIDIIYSSIVTGLRWNDAGLTGIEITNTDTDRKTEIPTGGLFVAVGLLPDTAPFQGLIELDQWGYVAADERCLTNLPGVFTAGDCRAKGVRQVSTAAADGAVAAVAAIKYLG